MNYLNNKYIRFSKYHGAGNDFIMINCFSQHIELTSKIVFKMCDRHLGIGADGLILLLPSKNHDFKMKYYNCDGKESTFCGNGGRCITAFAYREKIIHEYTEYEAIDGIHKAYIKKISPQNYNVELTMCDISSYDINEKRLIIDTGSPHYVTIVKDLNNLDVKKEGAAIRYDKAISKEGVNVDFMSLNNGEFYIRTYERGVENETLSCGTGVTASAIAASLWYGGNDININTKIEKFKIRFKRKKNSFKDIILSGPVTYVFNGIYIFAV